MNEDENERKQRIDLQKKKEKWTLAADNLAELVRKFAAEDANEESDNNTSAPDSGYDSVTPLRRSSTPPADPSDVPDPAERRGSVGI
jgi:hypothetical protein